VKVLVVTVKVVEPRRLPTGRDHGHLVDQPVHLPELRVGSSAGRESCPTFLEDLTKLEYLVDVGSCVFGDESATVRFNGDKSVIGQSAKRCPDRSATDAEVLTNYFLGEMAPRPMVARDDAGSQHLVDVARFGHDVEPPEALGSAPAGTRRVGRHSSRRVSGALT
jgi:hypothetical protein